MEVLHVTLNQSPIDESETLYRFHSNTDPITALHDHDFYELLFIVSGSIDFFLQGNMHTLNEGDLALIRPGDAHQKLYSRGPCQNINLDFPAATMDALFSFMYSADIKKKLDDMPFVPIIHLAQNDKRILHQSLERLNLLPANRRYLIRMHLRLLLLDIFKNHYSDLLLDDYQLSGQLCPPDWMNQILQQMADPATFSYHLEDWARISGKSKEYFCRSFQKYLNKTPSSYLNALRLNYAANLLSHTDTEIIDISFDSGFQSLSYFYHLFKQEFGLSPLKYRERNQRKSP